MKTHPSRNRAEANESAPEIAKHHGLLFLWDHLPRGTGLT